MIKKISILILTILILTNPINSFAREGHRIGIFDMGMVFSSQQIAEIVKNTQEYAKEKEEHIVARANKEVEAKKKEIEKQSELLSESAKKEKEKELETAVAELQQKYQNEFLILKNKLNKVTEGILTHITKSLEEVASEVDLDIVIPKPIATQQQPFFAKAELDVTARVKEKLELKLENFDIKEQIKRTN